MSMTMFGPILKGNERQKKYRLFLEIRKEYLEASNIMFPSEYVSIRKYGHLKFRYS